MEELHINPKTVNTRAEWIFTFAIMFHKITLFLNEKDCNGSEVFRLALVAVDKVEICWTLLIRMRLINPFLIINVINNYKTNANRELVT